jgi:DNA-binding NarL/FixJ family response regulator
MKLELGEMAAIRPAAALELHADVREALKQALSETLLRMTARENLEALLAQIVLPRAVPHVAVQLPEPPPSCALLTRREREILDCIARGDSNKAIARTFDLSVHTVKRHVANILGKLGVSSRVQAATWLHARH